MPYGMDLDAACELAIKLRREGKTVEVRRVGLSNLGHVIITDENDKIRVIGSDLPGAGKKGGYHQ